MKICICRMGVVLCLLLPLFFTEASRPSPPSDPDLLPTVRGLSGIRFWGDLPIPKNVEPIDELAKQILSDTTYDPVCDMSFLVISGGGSRGAFGAGWLSGWSDSGTRPTFRLVTGISTGALTAPFAFLGEAYDDVLEELYTLYSTTNILDPSHPNDNSRLRSILKKYIGQAEIQKIADEYRKGRRLVVGTTWLDVLRPVAWDLSAIAASGSSESLDTMLDVMLASAGVPGLLPPVLFESTMRGSTYGELHADGGLAKLEFLEPIAARIGAALSKVGRTGPTMVYILHNDRVAPAVAEVKIDPNAIISSALLSLFRSNGFYALNNKFNESRIDGEIYQLTYIPASFTQRPREVFDIHYMRALFTLAHDTAKEGPDWQSQPPPYPALSGLQQRLMRLNM
jgi:hypothetical protein